MQQTQFESKRNLVNLSPGLHTLIYVPLIFSLGGFFCGEFAAPPCSAFRFSFSFCFFLFFSSSLPTPPQAKDTSCVTLEALPPASLPVKHKRKLENNFQDPVSWLSRLSQNQQYSPRRKPLQDNVQIVAGCPQQIWESWRRQKQLGGIR